MKKEVAKEVAKKDSKQVVIAGVVTTAMYGKRNFSTGQSDDTEKYRVSIKVKPAAVQALKDAAETEYLNFSSSFDIRIGELGVNNRMFDKGTMSECATGAIDDG